MGCPCGSSPGIDSPMPDPTAMPSRSVAADQSLLPIYLCCLAFGLQAGTGMPLIPLGLEQQGVDRFTIGIVSAAWGLGMLATTSRVPALAERLGAVPLICAGTVANSAVCVALAYTEGVALWFGLAFLSGSLGAVPWVVSETWINLVVEEKRRGRAVAIYATMVALGLAGGPLVLQLVGVYGPRPFLLAAALGIPVVLPLLLFVRHAPSLQPGPHGSVAGILLLAPVILLAGMTSGLGEQSAMSFLPIFALDSGVSAEIGASWLSAFVIGNLALQWPIGWMADHVDRRLLLAGCAAASALLAGLVAAIDPSDAIVFLVLMLWGGASFGIYTVGLALLGQKFSRGDMVRANAAFAMVYTLGGLIGRPTAGAAMDAVGRAGLPLTVAVFYVLAALAALVAFQRRER